MLNEFEKDYYDRQGPFFIHAACLPSNGRPNQGTIALVDDSADWMNVGMEWFCLSDFYIQGYLMNKGRPASEYQIRIIAEEIAIKGQAKLAVVDMSLGLISGIDLVKALKDFSVATILLTGAGILTEENRRIADLYLHKPIRPSLLERKVKDLLSGNY